MPTPGAKDYAIDLALTNFAVNYRVTGTIGRGVITNVPVAKENGEYHKWTKDDIFRLPETARAEGAEANEIEIGKTKVSYAASEQALRIPLTYRSRDNADSVLSIRQAKTMWVEDFLQLRLEKKIFALYSDAAVPSVTLAGTAQWQIAGGGQGGTSVPEFDIDTGKESIRKATGGKNPNTIIIPAAVAKAFKRHTTIRDSIKYTHGDILTNDQDLPPTLWGMQVWIPTPVETTSKEGAATTVRADVWSDSVYLAYISPIPDPDTFTFASLFWINQEVRIYDEPKRKAELIEASHLYDMGIVDADAAYAIKDTLA